MARKTNDAGIKLIQGFEQCVLHVYKDAVGLPTIGWGHLIKPGEKFTTITQEQADELFKADIVKYEQAVENATHVPLTDNQFGALVALCFNIGTGAFQSSSLVKCLNAGSYEKAAEKFLQWNKGKVNGKLVEIAGLTRRRQAEKALFERVDG